jgi:carboxyl-terminal processing protease
MQSRSLISIIAILALAVILSLACVAVGFLAGWSIRPATIVKSTPLAEVIDTTVSQDDTDIPTLERSELFIPFWEAWGIVHDQYLEQPVDDEILMQGAIQGMMEALGDQHSSYMDPDQYRDATINLTGEYEGIGAWVSTEGEYLTIVEPMEGSPAKEAGLRPGDQIIAIDGEDMTGILPEIARLKVLGPANTSLTLTILRTGEEAPFDVELVRDSIIVPSVESEILEGNIAYVRLRTFAEKSGQELHDTLQKTMDQKPSGLIFDLRNNSGGALSAAIEVASQFIDEGVITFEEFADGSRNTYDAGRGGLATEIPLVLLVNEFSASASELVAGSIQDHERAPLVGVTTFGKGTVQRWIDLSNEQGAVRVTIARWLTPNGVNVHEIGLTPDYIVELTDEDFDAERDPQLDKAIEILLEELK